MPVYQNSFRNTLTNLLYYALDLVNLKHVKPIWVAYNSVHYLAVFLFGYQSRQSSRSGTDPNLALMFQIWNNISHNALHLYFKIQISNLILTIIECIFARFFADTYFQINNITFYGKKSEKQN